jgi:bacterioferritin
MFLDGENPAARHNVPMSAGADRPLDVAASSPVSAAFPADGPEVRRASPPRRVVATAPGPYPEPAVQGPSPEYAAMLLEDYAGRGSEFTAIAQYIYHSLVVPEGYGWIADLLEDLAMVEMRHLDLLGETIKLLGADPRYYAEDGVYWNSRNVAYRQGLREQLEADIEAERSAIAQYERHYGLIGDPKIRQLLARIVADEQLHLFLLRWTLNYVR